MLLSLNATTFLRLIKVIVVWFILRSDWA